ncbi:hypothetical protein PFLUV_G00239260 [Perca fluviatilis]|uniref:SNTX MACPF/CDC-like domain-containing protein n=1 Tax=Perca fluviatilis TaxID=8168 RepID=A0A6A5DW45_PERFL|nr:hypothetical protein PFLUV_G00239260 [Perca fluviatilis]
MRPARLISDFLTNRPQRVRISHHTSSSIILNTGVPQGCVLSPVLYSLFTHDCTSSTTPTPSSNLLKSDNNEIDYRKEVQTLSAWCLTLWDDKTLRGKISESSQRTSKSQISTSDTTESKCKLLDVEVSLKASVLGGLIEFGGSAKYLNDQKKFYNQSRVTCQYKTTTNFKQLMIEQLTMDPQHMDVIKKSSATHVVTGILYGANAFFVFDSEKVEASSVQDIQVSMEARKFVNTLAEAVSEVQIGYALKNKNPD